MNISVKEALIERKAVIWALLNREMTTRFDESYFSYAWLIIEPLLFVLILASIFYFLGRNTGDMPILLFLLTGIVPFFYFKKAVMSCAKAISANKALLTYRQVKIFDVIISRILLETTISICVAFICSFIIILFFENTHSTIYYPARIIFALIMLLGLAFGTSLCIAIMSYYYIDLDKFLGVVFRFLFFTSGIFFSLEQLPNNIAYYLSFNPLFQVIELIRSAFNPSYMSIYLSYKYVFGLTIIVIFLGVGVYFTSRENILMNDRSR
ncbi:capsular polysaccharide transport system permease protein [Allofrancisella inopinata]|uniref:Transport permease protein n=1 Tax=Allofrancisella inopinata TaxID=1085647 RepID=A0AAE7CRL7_9GAMM|nr:ABC transporter permease [Allofrancisella inopinata]QIV96509.1 ABC transporter permease [Allofrancisella inopinata]TDT68496.1 capsular polysaccharide transport system permease protein [Allofrancisella inopinata]